MGNCNVLDKNMESSCICVYLSIQFGVGCRILGSMNLKIENCLAHACAEKVQLSYHQSNPTDKKNRFCESKLPDHHLLISEPHPAKVKTVQFEIKAVSTKDRLLYIMFIMSKSCHACKYTGLRRIRWYSFPWRNKDEPGALDRSQIFAKFLPPWISKCPPSDHQTPLGKSDQTLILEEIYKSNKLRIFKHMIPILYFITKMTSISDSQAKKHYKWINKFLRFQTFLVIELK